MDCYIRRTQQKSSQCLIIRESCLSKRTYIATITAAKQNKSEVQEPWVKTTAKNTLALI